MKLPRREALRRGGKAVTVAAITVSSVVPFPLKAVARPAATRAPGEALPLLDLSEEAGMPPAPGGIADPVFPVLRAWHKANQISDQQTSSVHLRSRQGR